MPLGNGLLKPHSNRPVESKEDDFRDDDFGSPGRKDDFQEDNAPKPKSSKSSTKDDDMFNEFHHSAHSHHSHSSSPKSKSPSRSPSHKSQMSESKFEESKDDDAPSYMSKRAQLISRISEYKTILTEKQQKDIESNNLINDNEKWKYSLLTKTNERQKSGSLSGRSMNRSQSARLSSTARSTAEGDEPKKKLSTQEYIEKLAVPHKIVNNQRNTIDLYEKVKKIKCTCVKGGPCNPLKPGPGCARAKVLYATESEIKECTFKPKITKYKSNQNESKLDFVERMDSQTRAARAKKADAIGEKEYNMRLDILTCPVCGGKQSYKNYIEGKDKCPTCLKKYKPKKAWGSIANSFLNRNVVYLQKKNNPEMKKKEIDWESRCEFYCKCCGAIQTKEQFMKDVKKCPNDGSVFTMKYAREIPSECQSDHPKPT